MNNQILSPALDKSQSQLVKIETDKTSDSRRQQRISVPRDEYSILQRSPERRVTLENDRTKHDNDILKGKLVSLEEK